MNMRPFAFEPTRLAGLAQLQAFLPRAGRHYAAHRNTDEGPGQRSGVSMLSPWIRFRTVTEEEVLAATLDRFSLHEAEKFVQEVFWRSYFKGHLETRPSIWADYLRALSTMPHGRDHEAAMAGRTGIDCFDAWVRELVTTGYLHNHARMWFASIWIFTLRLPWFLGADFMYRHLIDGDPASNTLSWRWVGGLHTRGKTYLARADNIDRYTDGRFRPKGLATEALALEEAPSPPALPVPAAAQQWPTTAFGLLVTTEDLDLPANVSPQSIAIPLAPVSKPGGVEASIARDFKIGALNDVAERAHSLAPVRRIASLQAEAVLAWCVADHITTVAVAFAPVGPEADALREIEAILARNRISLLRVRRRYDALCWPHASKGFFAMKEKIPDLLRKLNIGSAQQDLF
jgi:deoxyribodipyrimidine photo-lyase